MNDIHFSSKSNEWETPRWLFDILNQEFNFQLDAASTTENALCSKFFTQDSDALVVDWSQHKSIFLNPPYSRLIGKFIKKAYEESQKDCTVVLLIPARTDTRFWHDYCSKGEVRFIRGRLKFVNKAFPSWNKEGNFKSSPAPFPSAIVIFRKDMVSETKYIDIKGHEK